MKKSLAQVLDDQIRYHEDLVEIYSAEEKLNKSNLFNYQFGEYPVSYHLQKLYFLKGYLKLVGEDVIYPLIMRNRLMKLSMKEILEEIKAGVKNPV